MSNCTKCGIEFIRTKSEIRNRKGDCRACRTTYERERRLKNQEPYRKACAKWRKKDKHNGRTLGNVKRSIESIERKDLKQLAQLLTEDKLLVTSYE